MARKPPVRLLLCIMVASPILLPGYFVSKSYDEVKKFTKFQRRKWKRRKADRRWKAMPRRANGTIITGALSVDDQKLADAIPATGESTKKVLAAVPPEIWREIILHATESYPAPYSIHDLSAPTATSEPQLSEDALYRLHRLSTHIKCKLSRVSQSWRNITKEFRFQSVWIVSPNQAQALGRIILKEEAAGITGKESCAWWIRKLYIDLTRHAHESDAIDQEYWYKGIPIISKCPRLLHYRHSLVALWGRPGTLRHLLHDIFPTPTNDSSATVTEETATEETAFPTSMIPLTTIQHTTLLPLTTLDWSDDFSFRLYVYLQDNQTVLKGALSQLQHLTIRSYSGIRRMRVPEAAPLCLPALHTLRVGDANALGHPSFWELPSLRSLSIAGNCPAPIYEERAVTFLKAHGFKLEELEIVAHYPYRGVSEDFSLERLCPNLQVVQVSIDNLPLLPKDPKNPSGIRKVAIVDLELAASHGYSSHVLKTIGGLKLCMPHLEVLQDNGVESDQVRLRALERKESQQARPFVTFYEALEAITISNGIKLVDWKNAPIVITPLDNTL